MTAKQAGLMLAAAWLLLCVPLFVAQILPSVDFPNHLARAFLLARWDTLHGYGEFYRPQWAVLPNLALDLITVPLAKVFPPLIAGRIFVALLIGINLWGGARLSKAVTGYWSLWCLAPGLLIYSRIFSYGFFSFLFGLGIALWALSVHIERRDRRPLDRLWPAVLFAFALFACHLVTLALFLLLAGAYDLGRDIAERKSWRHYALDAGILLASAFLPAVLLLLASPTAGEATAMTFRDLGPKVKMLGAIFRTGQARWDTIFTLAVVALVVVLCLTKRLRLDKRMGLPALAVTTVFLLAPYGFKEAFNVDTRLPLVVAIVALMCLAPATRAGAKVAGFAVVGLLAFRVASTAVHYAAWQSRIGQAMADLRMVPAGSVLLQARSTDSGAFDSVAWAPPYIGLDCLLLLERPVFISNFFSHPTQQPMVRTAAFVNLDLPQRVGAAAAPDLLSFADQASKETAGLGIRRPVYLWYLKAPGNLTVPPTMRAIAIRDRYALLEVSPQRSGSSGRLLAYRRRYNR